GLGLDELLGARARHARVRYLVSARRGPAAGLDELALLPRVDGLQFLELPGRIGLLHEARDAGWRERDDHRRIGAFQRQPLGGPAEPPAHQRNPDDHGDDAADDRAPHSGFEPWYVQLHETPPGSEGDRSPFSAAVKPPDPALPALTPYPNGPARTIVRVGVTAPCPSPRARSGSRDEMAASHRARAPLLVHRRGRTPDREGARPVARLEPGSPGGRNARGRWIGGRASRGTPKGVPACGGCIAPPRAGLAGGRGGGP